MKSFEHRVLNGLLKAEAADSPEQLVTLLGRDCEIIAPEERSNESDLWPAIWALANVLLRQFTGCVYLNCGLTSARPAPIGLGSRCRFGRVPEGAIRIGLGCIPSGAVCWGDARGVEFSIAALVDSVEVASPLSCFAVAGYLGFNALASVAGIEPYREHLTMRSQRLPVPAHSLPSLRESEFTMLGLGHLGNAYISLLYFLVAETAAKPRLYLIDGDVFGEENRATQILLGFDGAGLYAPKVDYLADLVRAFGWEAFASKQKVIWGWQRKAEQPSLLLLGLHDFEGRRIALSGGFEWVFDAGLNSSFTHPRVSWNALPPSPAVANRLFPRQEPSKSQLGSPALRERLARAPGPCGQLEAFDGVTASAPCMGLVAAAFLWSEVISYQVGARSRCEGSLALWSQILPPLEEREFVE